MGRLDLSWVFCPALLLACSYSDSGGRPLVLDAEETRIFEVDIDTDARVEVSPGKGAGVFVEYFSGGDWEVFATCDTDISDLPCDYDIWLSVPLGEKISQVDGMELERTDDVFSPEKGVLNLLWFTASDFDRVNFRTTPGETLRLDVLIDGVPDAEIVFWNGYGALQFAAPSNPLDLTPTEL